MHLIGDVKDKDVVIIDDMIDTAGTLVQAVDALKREGARRILACGVHAVLSGPAIERIKESPLEEVIVTNSIPLAARTSGRRRSRVLSVAPAARRGDPPHPRRGIGLDPVRVGKRTQEHAMEMRRADDQKPRRHGQGLGQAAAPRAVRCPPSSTAERNTENVAVDPKDVLRMLVHGHEGSTQLLTVTFDGDSGSRMAIIRDMQFDPVSENLLHVDLQEVAMDRAIPCAVAVHHVGEAVGVKDTQGILEMVLREVGSPACPATSRSCSRPTSPIWPSATCSRVKD